MKTVRKAVIPAAGLGTRFLPATKAQPKEMLPVVDKPAIQYVVEEAVRAGIRDILVITGRGKRSLEDHFDRSFELEHYLEVAGRQAELDAMREIADMADIHYLRQGDPKGLGHAVSVAREHVGDEPFAVMLGDDIMHESVSLLEQMIEVHARLGTSVVALQEFPLDQISNYGCARAEVVDDHLVRVLDLVEKPKPEEAPSNLGVVGRYVFTAAIFDALARVGPGKGGEIQLTDAMALMLAEGTPVHGIVFRGLRHDTGAPLGYLQTVVRLACDRDDLGPEFAAWLKEFVAGLEEGTGPGRRPLAA